ncbi:MAG TPA: SpoIID/LytB domain-containing protein [Patescibacteria group bacterium]|jgi:peptidoglycan hydrolase-like amidase/peptidoglycan hydrolase CwlO-like protein|nr:SpoIID/LytB domain-containing protein [Patescibacteria group bacterium]
MKKLLFLLFLIIFMGLGIILIPSSKAQTVDCQKLLDPSYNNQCNADKDRCLADTNTCMDQLATARQQSVNATIPLETEINSMKSRIAFIEASLAAKKKDIDAGYANLAKQQEILNATIRDYYIKSYYDSPLLILLSANSATQLTQLLGYQKSNADRDKAIITNIAVTINDLKSEKAVLESEEISISATKAKLDVIVAGALAYQATLSNQIVQLSALQQQILAQRLGALNIPLYAYNTQGGCSSDIGKDPGFSGGFGFFTYGVPNRVGLNQYGAWGRAKAGQDATTILHAYYNFDSIDTRDAQIHVTGNGVDWTGSLDDYVRRIYEVPDSWTDNNLAALKAQAIAARSYALAYTNNGQGTICPTDQCQVFQTNPKGGNWDQAVSDTAGQVMIQGGNPIKAWFSSTHGGYIFSSGDIGWSSSSWTKDAQDTSSNVGSFPDLKSNAYDKDSPWFYCDWGSRSDYNKTAWLKSDEVADIVNVILLLQNDSSVKDHLYQTDKSNPAGTDTWDSGRVKQELSKYRTPYNNVSDISVSADFGSGKATSVNISGDAGSVSISASDFKNYFNLRAPANIQIVGPLYNVEKE